MVRKLMVAMLVLIGAGLIVQTAQAADTVAPPGRTIHVKTQDYEFYYSYPAAAGRIPALKAVLDKDAAGLQADLAENARDGHDEAKQNDFTFNSFVIRNEWSVVTDLPGWLSLSGMFTDYEGGAHPNHNPLALLWDKTENRKVEVADLFVSSAALSAAIREPFCKELNRQRAARRGEPVDPESKDSFDACLDPVKETVILGSADHRHFTRIGVLMGPYEAGSYAEGDYEVTLPVTQAVLSAVRPKYRAAFAPGH